MELNGNINFDKVERIEYINNDGRKTSPKKSLRLQFQTNKKNAKKRQTTRITGKDLFLREIKINP